MAASGMMLYSCCRKGIVTNGAPILYKREVTPSRDKTFSSSQETQRERERERYNKLQAYTWYHMVSKHHKRLQL